MSNVNIVIGGGGECGSAGQRQQSVEYDSKTPGAPMPQIPQIPTQDGQSFETPHYPLSFDDVSQGGMNVEKRFRHIGCHFCQSKHKMMIVLGNQGVHMQSCSPKATVTEGDEGDPNMIPPNMENVQFEGANSDEDDERSMFLRKESTTSTNIESKWYHDLIIVGISVTAIVLAIQIFFLQYHLPADPFMMIAGWLAVSLAFSSLIIILVHFSCLCTKKNIPLWILYVYIVLLGFGFLLVEAWVVPTMIWHQATEGLIECFLLLPWYIKALLCSSVVTCTLLFMIILVFAVTRRIYFSNSIIIRRKVERPGFDVPRTDMEFNERGAQPPTEAFGGDGAGFGNHAQKNIGSQHRVRNVRGQNKLYVARSNMAGHKIV